MTSGTFSSFPINNIFVNRKTRQRRELNGLDELADSIRRTGLINPITIRRSGELIAGERRWNACKQLGWTAISVQFVEDLAGPELQLVELEENIRREAITWDDECRAIKTYHELRRAYDPEWNTERTAEALGFKQSYVDQHMAVANALEQDGHRVHQATKFSTARDVVTRERERKKQDLELSLMDERPAVPLINADFHEWAKTYSGPKFNLLHCDFPYGQDHSDGGQKTGRVMGAYEDTADVYHKLLVTLSDHQHKFMSPTAHIIFWFSMHSYGYTKDWLEGAGWVLDPFPLIWKKHMGTLPDPNRKPFRKYETAFFGSLGDRKIVTAVDNIFDATATKELHMSEKPVDMLKHFFRMVVDETTLMLDPTSGSGNAVKVAAGLGAKLVLGIEKDKEFYDRAVAGW